MAALQNSFNTSIYLKTGTQKYRRPKEKILSSGVDGSSRVKCFSTTTKQITIPQKSQVRKKYNNRSTSTNSTDRGRQKYIGRIDSFFIMITMLLVAVVVMSGNVAFAAQRDSFRPKDPNNVNSSSSSSSNSNSNNNNPNVIPNAISGSSGSSSSSSSSGSSSNNGNGNSAISNVNSNVVSPTSSTTTTMAAAAATATVGSLSSGTSINTFATTGKTTTSTTTTTTSTSPTTTIITITKTTNINSNSISNSVSQKVSNSITGGNFGVSRNIVNEITEEMRNGPYFDRAASKNVTALLGKTAYLNCRVKNLGNKTMLLQVSWVRHRDIHLLTVGRYTYTSDQRFRAIHQPQTEDWILQIKYPQHRDSGIYECQVSTTPHMSHYIHLNVVEPSTEIIGAPDLYIESGSTINLTCVILNSPEPPAYIFWNHNNAIINYDSPRGGVSVVTNKGETTTSFLLIKSARPSDSGHYQCNPSNAKPKSVTVHVLNGEFPAAMQHAVQAFHQMSQNHYLLVYLSVYFCTLLYARQYIQVPRIIGI